MRSQMSSYKAYSENKDELLKHLSASESQRKLLKLHQWLLCDTTVVCETPVKVTFAEVVW